MYFEPVRPHIPSCCLSETPQQQCPKQQHQKQCNLLNDSTVLVARYFQKKVEVFFIEIILYCPLGKTFYR